MFSLVLGAAVIAATPDAAALLDSADDARIALHGSVVTMRATVSQEGKPPKVGEFDVYIRDDEHQLVAFKDKRNEGRRFLMVRDKAWLIVPNAEHPIAVTPSQRMIGAVSYADVARVRLSRDYQGTLRPRQESCGDPPRACHVVDVTATARSAPYAAGTLWIDGGLVHKAVYSLPSGKPAKEVTYHYAHAGGQVQLTRTIVTDLLLPKARAVTTLDYLGRRRIDMPASLFDPQQATP